jgi:hypothetical protein
MIKASTVTSLPRTSSSSIQPPNLSVRLTSRLQNIWQQLIEFAIGNTEIKIWKSQSPAGYQLWHVYDPATKQSAYFKSETEVRVWLEQRYYR